MMRPLSRLRLELHSLCTGESRTGQNTRRLWLMM